MGLDTNISKVTATTYDKAGFPETQVELYGDGASCAPCETYHPAGFIGRPNDPSFDPSGKAQVGAHVLYYVEGNQVHTLILNDPRRTQRLPAVDKGGSMMYADVDGAYTRYKGDGTYECRVPAGKTVTVQVGSGASVVVSDATVAIGDQAARALAHAQEILVILAGLVTEITGDIALLTTPPSSITFALYAPQKAALLTALQTTIANQLATLPTVKAMGT